VSLKVIFEPKPIESAEGILSANKVYAGDVEFGTLPHVIKAKPGGVLVFQAQAGSDIKSRRALFRNKKTGKLQKSKSKNTLIFTKSVNHPGTKAQPYLRPAVLDNLPRIARIIGKGLIEPVVNMENIMTSVMLGVLSASQALVPVDSTALKVSLRQEVI
jgi:hypothetical protein